MSAPSTAISEPSSVNPAHSRWFEQEVHTHDASLKNYLRQSFPTVRDVEDVVQESYLRVWRRQLARPINQVSGPIKVSVKGFLFQVARRLALDILRRAGSSPFVPVGEMAGDAEAGSQVTTRDRVCTNEEFHLLLQAIERLPMRCRQVVILRKLHALSPAETAVTLGISEDTVHVQARLGLQRVQKFLREHGVIRGDAA